MNYAVQQRLRIIDFLLATYGTLNRAGCWIPRSGDDWAEPDPEFHDEHTTCLHGVAPRSDCDWCQEQTDND